MTTFLQLATAFSSVATAAVIGWLTWDAFSVVPWLSDLRRDANDLARYLRRKWRQQRNRWREILRTNKDWSNHG